MFVNFKLNLGSIYISHICHGVLKTLRSSSNHFYF